jgi:hypothetical protein
MAATLDQLHQAPHYLFSPKRLKRLTPVFTSLFLTVRDVVLANHSGILDPADVSLVVEIVSPGSRTTDRLTKPALYARAGIASFWRVELDEGPAIFAYRLEQDRYRLEQDRYRLEQDRYAEAGSARPGERLVVTEPYALSLDPADLRP